MQATFTSLTSLISTTTGLCKPNNYTEIHNTVAESDIPPGSKLNTFGSVLKNAGYYGLGGSNCAFAVNLACNAYCNPFNNNGTLTDSHNHNHMQEFNLGVWIASGVLGVVSLIAIGVGTKLSNHQPAATINLSNYEYMSDRNSGIQH